MATACGELRLTAPIRGGLAPRQRRRAEELLDADLDGGVSIMDLASTCRLSVRHFARAFRESTGLPPHRWLMQQRLFKAKGLLLLSARSLDEVATACRFASQSHFTRVFTRSIGMSPGARQRMRRN